MLAMQRWGKPLAIYSVVAVMALLSPVTQGLAGEHAIGFFVGDSDAYACAQAIKDLELPQVELAVFTAEDIHGTRIKDFIKRMDIAVVDIMPRQLPQWLLANRSAIKPEAVIYAVRQSSHTRDFLNAGFTMDRTVGSYFSFTSAQNLSNLIRYLAHRDLGIAVKAAAPARPPKNALYHPDAPAFFPDPEAYFAWYRKSGHYRSDGLWDLTVVFPTFPLEAKKAPVDALIRAYENNGINTLTWLRDIRDWNKTLDRLISTEPVRGRLGSITGLTFKFSAMRFSDMATVLLKADVPIFNPQYLFFSTAKEWLTSTRGIAPAGIALQFGVPELSGLVEPSVIGVKERVPAEVETVNACHYVPVAALVQKMARRASRWHRLKQMANQDKKVVLVYYNHGGGKQNIGASYLNVFRSIRRIVRRMRQEGYTVDGDLSEVQVKDLLLQSGRNIGAWAPDELNRLVREGHVVKVSIAQYKQWLTEIDPGFRHQVEKDWGRAEDSDIMTHDGAFVIPCIRLGNLILAPQPSRGWSDDPEKLYHSKTLYPHHQYVAFYLWLQKMIHPDAMISLGTHGTHEWLPGKQAGLSAACSPEVLIGDIPNLYPYIVDDVGEGIQAKRRGRGVIIDHATPPFKQGGLYEAYSKLAALISEYDASSSPKAREAKLARIAEMALQLGLDKDLGIAVVDDGALEKIEHYLLALKTEMIPYGLHTFGISPDGEGLEATAAAIAARGDQSTDDYKAQLAACGPSEIESLMRGLRGGYIPPASGNDPLRNPESLPTGKNFYAFDPDKVPSKAAWANGKKAAAEIIAAYREGHDGHFPGQIGLILWSVETIRDEGINVATALCLLGMQPQWDHRDKVRGVAPIAGHHLQRPRIDVLLQMSGLFRDTFPSVALMLDQAVKQAAALDDVANFVKAHSRQIARHLVAEGYTGDEARKLSLVRLFSAPPGAYGTKVDNMTAASGLWENDDTVAEQGFVETVSFGYATEIWGQPMKAAFRQNLKKIDATVHTISSNLYGTMDNDDMFQYLGGLSMAAGKAAGKDPDVFVCMQKRPGREHIEPLALTIGSELRSRYLNPQWIKGMQKESYAGARAMAGFLENMWGWQVATPKAIDKAKWEQTYAVYVEDQYGLELKAFFNKHNPWAYQSLTARMLEAVRKDYWQADEKITRKLAAEYALNVVAKGVACCDHTCNNPMLNKMVVNVISLPGMLSPEVVEKFKLAVEKAAAKSLDEQVIERKNLLARLTTGLGGMSSNAGQPAKRKQSRQTGAPEPDASKTVEGYKMEAIDTQDEITDLSSSGIQWAASFFILLLMALFVWGSWRRLWCGDRFTDD